MRAPIGFRISNRRKSLKISQAALARLVVPSVEMQLLDADGQTKHYTSDMAGANH